LLSGFVSLAVGVLIYGQNPNHAVNRMFLVLCAVLFYYEFTSGYGFLQAVDVNAALQWLTLAAFWYLLPVVLFHICVVYANVSLRKLVLFLIYASAILFALLEFLAAPYELYRMTWGWGYRYTGYFGYVQVFWVIVPSIASLLVLLRRYHTVKNREEKTGVVYVLCGVLIPVVTGIFITVLPFLTQVDLPDLTPPAAAVGFLLVGYAVFRYGIQILTASAAADDILSTMVDALFLVDTEGRIIVTNKAASRLLGFEKQELAGRLLSTVSQNSGRQGILQRDSFPSTFETEFLTKQNRSIPVSVSRSAVLTKHGKLAGYVLICRDVTDRKQMEGRLAEAQRLAAIGQTTTMVGHDLRNPLQAMTAALYLVRKLVESDRTEDKKEAGELLNALSDTVRYMDKIVSDLQDYARPVKAEPVEINLTDLVYATINDVNVPENVDVSVDIKDMKSKIQVDPALLRRVLTNLIINAVQAMPKGGQLSIVGSVGTESIALAVRDTGDGIAPENLERVFMPFFTTKAKGQGLGLAVCKRLMATQGGTISVTSQLGKGSIFAIKMPVHGTPP